MMLGVDYLPMTDGPTYGHTINGALIEVAVIGMKTASVHHHSIFSPRSRLIRP